MMQNVGRTSTLATTLGSIIAILAIVAWFYVFYKFYQNYKNTEKKQSQYFAFALLFGAIAIFLLALELVTFQIFDNGTEWGSLYNGKEVLAGLNAYDLGLGFGVLAAMISSFSIFYFCVFALSFFEDKMKWLVIPGLMILIYAILYLVYWPEVHLNSEGTDFDITRDDQIELIMISLFIGPIFMPVVVFLLSALQVRENTFNFRRSLTLAFFFTIIGIGYTIEIVGAGSYFSVIARIMILIFPLGVRITLNPGDRMKRLLGAPS